MSTVSTRLASPELTSHAGQKDLPASRWWLVLVLGWLGMSVLGLGMLWDDAAAPGAVGTTPATWPEETALPLAPTRTTLVMFAHPACACTRASMSELARLLTQVGTQVDAHVVIFRPAAPPPGWDETALAARAREIGADVIWDDAGEEAQRFGAETSGFVVAYAPDQHLLYAGGITVARGHEGASAGFQRLLHAINATPRVASTASVFGCGIDGETEERR